MGIESRFISGLRVTDRRRGCGRDGTRRMLNKRIAGAISAAGQPAIGLCASDSGCFLAEPMQHDEVVGALGFVGYLTGVNVEFLESLWRAGIVPVASCLGMVRMANSTTSMLTIWRLPAPNTSMRPADLYDRCRRVLDGSKVMKAVSCSDVEE